MFRKKLRSQVDAAGVIRQIASGMGALHAVDILHRDLKCAAAKEGGFTGRTRGVKGGVREDRREREPRV